MTAPAPLMPLDDRSLLEACRAGGLRATPQRLAILRALRRNRSHPSPEALHEDARGELASLSLATVYKTLDVLEAHGLIEEVTLRADSKRYDGNLVPHHHLVCVRCKKIEDVVEPALTRALPSSLAGFEITSARMHLMGVCANCAKANKSRRAAARRRV